VITAVDTSVLLDVFFAYPTHGAASAEALRTCLRKGTLRACPVVWAEVAAAFEDPVLFRKSLDTLGVAIRTSLSNPPPWPAASGKATAVAAASASASWPIS
jgi:predicted nucleic acid-binding protein